MHGGVGRHDAEVHLDRRYVGGAEQQRRPERGRRPEQLPRGHVEREEPQRDDGGPDEAGDDALREQRVALKKGQPEGALLPRGTVQVGHENEPRQHVGDDDLRPRHHRDASRPARQQARVEDQLLRHEAERHGEQEARRHTQRGDRAGHRDTEQREHREVHDRVGGDQTERGRRDVLPRQRAREHGRRVERPAGEGVHQEKPQCDNEAGEEPADDAVSDQLIDGSLHRSLLLLGWRGRAAGGAPLTEYRASPASRNRFRYGALPRRFPILS